MAGKTKEQKARNTIKTQEWRAAHRARVNAWSREYARQRRRKYPELLRGYARKWRLTHLKQSRINSRDERRKRQEFRPWFELLRSAKRRAEQKGMQFLLTAKWARDRWAGKCEISEVPFITVVASKKARGPYAPSLDRIEPERGYVEDNCRFILFGINCLKGSGTDADMNNIAQAVVHKRSMQ